MANFIAMVYATLKADGVDTKGMNTDQAVEEFNKRHGSDGSGKKTESTPAEKEKMEKIESKDEGIGGYSNEETADIIADGEKVWVKTDEDKAIWKNLSDDEKFLLSMSGDMGFWYDEIQDNDEMLEKYNDLASEFSTKKQSLEEQRQPKAEKKEKGNHGSDKANSGIEGKVADKIREHFKTFSDEEYNDYIGDYLHVETEPQKDGRTKIEVRAELGYDEMTGIADRTLDKFIQSIDEDAYFDQDDAGIMSAYVDTNKLKSFEEGKPAPQNIDKINKEKLVKLTEPEYARSKQNAKRTEEDIKKDVASWSADKQDVYYDLLENDLERAEHSPNPEKILFGGTLLTHKRYMRAIAEEDYKRNNGNK